MSARNPQVIVAPSGYLAVFLRAFFLAAGLGKVRSVFQYGDLHFGQTRGRSSGSGSAHGSAAVPPAASEMNRVVS